MKVNKKMNLALGLCLLGLCLLLLLAGCVKTQGLPQKKDQTKNLTTTKEANQSQEKNVVQPQPIEPSNSTQPSINTTVIQTDEEPLNETTGNETTPPEPSKSKNRIDVSTRSNGADVTALINGAENKFFVPDTDVDAIVFDISQELRMGVKEVRPLVYINGAPYLKPSELKKAQEKLAQAEAATFDPRTINISATKEEGFIRAVGCDLERRYLRVDLVNPTEKKAPLYKNRDVFPRVKDALILSLNRRMLENVNCQDLSMLEPGGNATCIKAGAIFISSGSHSGFETNASYDTSQPDIVGVNRPGYREQIEFYCKATNDTQRNQTS